MRSSLSPADAAPRWLVAAAGLGAAVVLALQAMAAGQLPLAAAFLGLGTLLAAAGGDALAVSALAGAAASLVVVAASGHLAELGGWAGVALDAGHRLGGGVAVVSTLLALATRASGSRGRQLAWIAGGLALAIASGAGGAAVLLGSGRDLVDSAYGNALLLKAVLAAAAAAILACVAWATLRPARSRWLAGVGLGIALLAVLVGGAMAAGSPSVERTPTIGGTTVTPVELIGRTAAATIRLVVDLPSPGEQLVQVEVTDPTSGAFLTDVTAVRLSFMPPAGSDATPATVDLERDGDAWTGRGTFTPVAGAWSVAARVTQPNAAAIASTLPLAVVEPLAAVEIPPPSTGITAPDALIALWSLMPPGPSGWLVLVMLLLAIALARRVTGRGPARTIVVGGLAILLLVAGAAIGGRELVHAANRPPMRDELAINPVRADAESIARGAALFRAACSGCHQAADFAGVATSQTPGALAWTIATGVAGTPMPGFSVELAERDRWDLVNYLRGPSAGP